MSTAGPPQGAKTTPSAAAELVSEAASVGAHIRIGLVGYGEVGRILAEDLRARGVARVGAYDIKLGTAQESPLREHAARHGVVLAASHAALAAESDFVVSAVTASQTVAVAEALGARDPARDTWYLDFNSASPGAKAKAAALIDGAGGRFVEGAVMTSVPPYRIRVPLLLGGPHAAALLPLLDELGFAAKVASDEARRRVGHQDVPQRHDQGPRSDGRRKLHRRARLRRRGLRAGVARGDLSRHRLGEARERTSSSA